MSDTVEAVGDTFERIHTALVKEDKKLDELLEKDLDVLALILIDCRSRDEIGRFGYFTKPRHAASVMGFFLTDGLFEDKLRAAGMPASAHEWRYLACARYWTQVGRVAAEMFRGAKDYEVTGLDVWETRMAIAAWREVFAALADKVLDSRVTFMRMAVDSGPAVAKAALEELELAAQVQDYANGKMAEVRAEYKSSFMRANMKEAAKAQATKKFAESAGGAASAAP